MVEWSEVAKMKKFILFLPFLAAFSSFVSACGEHGDEVVNEGTNLLGFGFAGNSVFVLSIIALFLLIALLIKKVVE